MSPISASTPRLRGERDTRAARKPRAAISLVLTALLATSPALAAPLKASTQPDENARMIRTLERLTRQTRANPASEEISEAHAAWVERVALLHDSRSVHALVDVIQTGNRATEALAELGDAALDPVVRVTHEADPARVKAAMVTLRSMLKPENLVAFRSPESASARIAEVLSRLCASADREQRSAACPG